MRASLQIFAALALAILGAGSGAPVAAANPEPPPPPPSASSPSAPPPSAPPGLDPSPGPTPQSAVFSVTSPQSGDFIGDTTVAISGTKEAGSSIHIPELSDCVVPADAHETWSCTTSSLSNRPDFSISPVQTLQGVETGLDHPILVDVLGPPTIDGGPTILTTGVISGMGYPGATIVLGIGATATTCPVAARRDGYWSCTLGLPSGTYPIQAWQHVATIGSPPNDVSNPTPVKSVTVDKEAPAQPVVSTPRDGQRVLSQPTTFAGVGETGGRVDAYVGSTIMCSAPVISGRWSCAASGIPNGHRSVQAVITDAAGNYGPPSSPIWVYFGPDGAVVPPPPPDGDGPPPSTPTPTETASPTPSPPVEPEWPPVWPSGPPAQSDAPTLQEALTNWGTTTGFGSHLPSAAATITNGNWLIGLTTSIGFIALVALPLRMLVRAMRGRFRFRSIQLTGRNRDPEVLSAQAERPGMNQWLAALVPLAAATALVVFSGGFAGEVRYLRLGLAVGLGLGILNLLAIAVAGKLAARSLGISGRLRILPTLLIGAAIAAVASRVVGIEPPFLIGVFVVIVLARELPSRSRAVVGLVEVVCIAALACGSWLLHEAIGPVDGFWATIPSEALAAMAIAGSGSVALMLLPVGSLPGRAILEWSPVVWIASSVVLVTVATGVLVSDPVPIGSLLVAGACGIVFAAVALASWAWARYVDPRHPDAA